MHVRVNLVLNIEFSNTFKDQQVNLQQFFGNIAEVVLVISHLILFSLFVQETIISIGS